MTKKRIIPCLDIKDGRTVKGVNFVGLRDAGNVAELARRYVKEGADELVFLDITATQEKRQTLTDLVKELTSAINIPFTVGGGISSLQDAQAIFSAGADKISINTSAVYNPELITTIADYFGRHRVVLAIDTKQDESGVWMVYINGGKTPVSLRTIDWAIEGEKRGAGEILLTSMNNDGTKKGFAIEMTSSICNAVNIPIIASGGAGTMDHFADIFLNTNTSAALGATVFHYGEISIPELKNYLRTQNIEI